MLNTSKKIKPVVLKIARKVDFQAFAMLVCYIISFLKVKYF